MIRFEHVRKEFPDAIPIKDVNCEIEDGKIVTIIGPSGTGKTTLLRMINGLEKPTSGKIFYNDKEITAKSTDICEIRKEIGMVFQSYNLFNHLTLLENIVVPQMDILKRSRAEAEKRALDLLEEVGLAHAKDKLPSQISGGQKQRVAIARTLAMDPKVILFDEPTSALDPNMTNQIAATLEGLKDGVRTLIIVTHDMKLSERVSDDVIFLSDGQVYERGTPEQIFHDPQKPATEIFIKQQKSMSLHVNTRDFSFTDAISMVINFCMNQQIGKESMNNLQLVVEELIGQIICSDKESRELKFLAGYDEQTGKMNYGIMYSGSEFDPLLKESISSRMVANEIENFEYEYVKDDQFANKMSFDSK